VIKDWKEMHALIGRRVRVMLDRKIEVAMLTGTLLDVTEERRVTIETEDGVQTGAPALWMIDFGQPRVSGT
jgi:hypothetical protein